MTNSGRHFYLIIVYILLACGIVVSESVNWNGPAGSKVKNIRFLNSDEPKAAASADFACWAAALLAALLCDLEAKRLPPTPRSAPPIIAVLVEMAMSDLLDIVNFYRFVAPALIDPAHLVGR